MHVCLFDIDGTLLASGGAGKAAMEMALHSEFDVTTPIEKITLSGRTDRVIGRDVFQQHGIEESPANWQRFIASYLRHLPVCLNQYRGRVLPGIRELLQNLLERGDTLVGLLTGNLQEGARLKLSHYALYEHFTVGGYGDHHLCRDDVARDALKQVQAKLNGSVSLERVWVIGDTPLDIRCARAIGVRVAAIATGWHPVEELAAHEPDLVLQDLSDPLPFLSKWK